MHGNGAEREERAHLRLVCDESCLRFAPAVRQGDGVATLPPRNPVKPCAPSLVPFGSLVSRRPGGPVTTHACIA